MKKILFLILITFSFTLYSQNKKLYDINRSNLQSSQNGMAKVTSSTYEVSNEVLSFTMLPEGYFTIGTNSGLSNSKLDDNCDITFGHPYAKTSYPVFSIDSILYKLDDYFSPSEMNLIRNGDTLEITATKSSIVSITFSMIFESDDNGVILKQKVKNLDSVDHLFGLGFTFDPALGKWGDGFLEWQSGYLSLSKNFSSFEIPDNLILREKSKGAKGIGVDITYPNEKPFKIIAANWNDLYNEDLSALDTAKTLYDLDLQLLWQEKTLGPDSLSNCQLNVDLITPDFSSQLFVRWDLPNYFEMTDNLMFPRTFTTYAEVSNLTGTPINCNINLTLSSNLKSGGSDNIKTIFSNVPSIFPILLTSSISYEDKVVEAIISVTENNEVIDELHRNIFVPATPVADTGLAIVDDSLSTNEFPNIKLFFSVERENTGQRIFNLDKENIFVYEDNNRINDFKLGKFYTGTALLADVVFVLDVSGSMGDNITKVRDNVGEFADSLAARGYDYQIGVVTFSDSVDHMWDLTNNIELIKQRLASIVLWGGDEDSPSGLYKATELSFRPGSKRTIIWITDEPYHQRNYTQQQIVNRMLSMEITVNGVGLNDLQMDWFDPIVIPTGGNFYDIFGNFRDILLDVSRMKATDKYLLSYQSKSDSTTSHEIKFKINYAGMGITKTYKIPGNSCIEYSPKRLSFYPNPFNPLINFVVNNSNYERGELKIYNVLGQLVKTLQIANGSHKITWNAMNDNGVQISTGLYIVRLVLTDQNESKYIESAKILFLK